MKILKRYVVIEFIKILLLISTGFMVLYLVVDIFENLGDFTKTHTDLITIVTYFLLRLPQAIYYMAPLSLLFASFLNLGLLTKYHEVTAMRSGGLSVLNITAPLLIITFIISVATFFLNDSFIPITNKRAEDIRRRIDEKPTETLLKQDHLWLRSNKYTLYNIRSIDADKEILWQVNIYFLTTDLQIRESMSADKAIFENGQWFLEEGIRRVFVNNNDRNRADIKVYNFRKLPIAFPFELQDLKHAVVQASETRFTILRSYINKISREGYEVKRLTVDLYAKTSFPFAGFLMAITGISLALQLNRYGSLAPGIGLSILASILYWACFSISLNMGYAGHLPAILSAWMANILFMGIGGYLFYRVARI